MTPEQFCYWLQGYFELTDAAEIDGDLGLTFKQAEMIKDHLTKVFNKDPVFLTGLQTVGDPKPLNDDIWPYGPPASC